ncbi:hypothetical protein S40285_04735 [Stachybotrys chlorohalonatus IBT 40285]|uniref:Uncharacterized protein n=1 Tax=Stachybotrys chlorohalonatus (strain IBT 40285) TaxID=1283841 RepID=A0A084Q9U5_STAC4|nr:hypothetical protein S40285_04735 [Stachybotrys chlorohalonata IBT 40285]
MEAGMGRRILAEVEEMSLEELLDDLRTTTDPATIRTSSAKFTVKPTHIPCLDRLITARHSIPQAATASLSGRSLPLVHRLVATLVSPPHRHVVLVIDLDARFDAARLDCAPEDLAHVYVLRPARRSDPETLRALVVEAQDWLVYGRGASAASASAARALWGTIVVGGLVGGLVGVGDVVTSWRGWLRVDRAGVPGFPMGLSAEEALASRDTRQAAVDQAGWAASSEWGGFGFNEARSPHGDTQE